MRPDLLSLNSASSTSSTMTMKSNSEMLSNRFKKLNVSQKKGYFVEYFKKSETGHFYKPKETRDEIKIEKKKSLMSPNERRKLNQNNIEDKLLILAQKNLDKRLSYSQLLIKREKILLVERLMDTKAINGDNLDREQRLNDLKIKSNLFSKQNQTNFSLNDHSRESIDMEIGHKNKNIFDKFIDQKRRNLPNYLKHNTKQNSKSFYDLKKVIERTRRANSTNRRICSRYQKHCKAEQRAQYYVSNKYLFKTFPLMSQTLAAQQNLIEQNNVPDSSLELILSTNETKNSNQISLPTIES